MAGLETDFNASRTLLELATRLGCACLKGQSSLEANLEKREVRQGVERLEKLIARIDPETWQRPPRRGYVSLLGSADIQELLSGFQSLDPVAHFAILRGLCPGALDLFFNRFDGHLDLTCGMPIPNATRPVQSIFHDNATPYQQSMTARLLLYRTGFDLFTEVDPSIMVTIDFSYRKRLDAITWSSSGLPRIGVVHSRLDQGRLRYRVTGHRVFDVGPSSWSLHETSQCLASVKRAQIAILPELSLPSPRALERELARNHKLYSPMVVAGSAHALLNNHGQQLRVNESRVYLDGATVLRHRKIRPLETKSIGNHRYTHLIREDLRPRQNKITLLSGEKTRMAVVICSDLIDRGIPRMLEECGVNLLLVPSLTYKIGSFNGAVCTLASNCQALCVVVNPILDQLDSQDDAPFTTIAAVPHSNPNEQSQGYFLPHGQTKTFAVLDPNRPLAAALQWG